MSKIKIIGLIGVIILGGIIISFVLFQRNNINDDNNKPEVNSFEECIAVADFIMESYPRQCRVDGKTFVEDIGNELEKTDLIQVSNPRPNQEIESPFVVTGQARGYWFFEASFPVVLVNWDGLIIAQGIAQAKGEWMTEDFVEFEATLEFERPTYSDKGTLILRKDNPSGLPENDDALEIPVIFKEQSNGNR